ncbi:MAG: ParB/RepB/Spo0J family partition protein [Rhodocyclaceae bacterium]|nr:ParB/RepB/Spo0J family partition protein [Rhodocyclaceae bacterium]MCA3025882.1 ParB/RepB/Spo0J family partition protein [Rhodocyclaceae bacterium]MCA3033521.1 ParB/RepB/Spo0J family partition protein [Rhodocyclaceae bacterium]MCA3036324.1 ParB/RepB/Spo0J family partition protein [Rhodocyclaceae bacterium]MCA3041014.1 ParB/RepB/Spo0J family partition protein [Rhodocyclaceae bacterium]
MLKNKGLGKGLDALLGGNKPGAGPNEGELRQLALTSLSPGKYQPRTHMDQAALAELADSIKQRGIVQPILVREIGKDKFEIIAGERRWRAAQLAGLATVPVLVREIADDAALGIGLIENIQREDLNAMEEAAGIQRLIDEFKLTHEEAAKAVGRSRSAVSNLLRLLELAKPVQDMVMAQKIDMGHARALLSLAKSKQVELAHQIVHKHLSVRDAERLAKTTSAPPKTKKAALSNSADVRRLEADLSDKLGTNVTIKLDKKNNGTVTIAFMGFEHLDGILERTKLK